MSQLGARGLDVVGVDGSPDMLEEARRANPDAEVHEADVEELPFGEGTFDLALCIEVLRYLPDPQGCIDEMARVLRPGGICLATAAPRYSVNGYAIVNRLALVAPVGDLVRLKQFFTTPSQLAGRFHRAGFSNVEIRAVYTGPLNWIEHLAPQRLPSFLRRWERVDQRLTRYPALHGLSNMLLVKAMRAS